MSTKVECCPACGVELIPPEHSGKPRSYQQHKRFFGMIRAAYFHWPEGYSVQFNKLDRHRGEHECRMWLLARVGHGTLAGSVPVLNMSEVAARRLATECLRLAGADAVTIVKGGEIKVIIPGSIAFEDNGGPSHTEFCAISDKVQTVIEEVCGAPMDQLLSTTPSPSARRVQRQRAA